MDYGTENKKELIGKKYKKLNKIGKGSFGEVYKGENLRTKEMIAIKLESVLSKSKLLKNEARIMKYLNPMEGISNIKWFGVDNNYTYLVFDLLGNSLDTYINRLGKFSLKTTILLGIQMIDRVKNLHNKGILHRDIKPDNFLMGRQDPNRLYIIDFGLSKNFLNNGEHIKKKDNKKMTGTVRYASINLHKGIEPSRRDDLISIGYVLIYFLKGKLPWQGVKSSSREDKYEKIGIIKENTKIESLCENLPKELSLYMHYCYDLGFSDNPNYNLLSNYLLIIYNTILICWLDQI